ncbi:MAG: 16S rRNA (adenine(1518)-N(6)/adenine(1519)-N(6))-dimethyltransferase RsmA [Trueperella sp.]|nr:16S rRNA (adenine(1518)-N(6)/adenine(1519)-N(6))-dimethyltransferase RsmA [Trueperella sp.]
MVLELLTPTDIRALADQLGIRPTKTLGQNFVGDAGTVRRIVRDAGVAPGDWVVEVGPGLGSLTLALLEAGAYVSAVEIDPKLAAALPKTLAAHAAPIADRCVVVEKDALTVNTVADIPVPPALAPALAGGTAARAEFGPTKLVANLPYNVSVPVLLNFLAHVPSLQEITVMVQAEVADRLAAQPGSRTYGVPSVKASWYSEVRRGAKISRNVFWPVPNVDSALVHLTRRPGGSLAGAANLGETAQNLSGATQANISRAEVFAVIDAAFAQRRKTLRAALATWAGDPAAAEQILRRAGIDPKLRGEALTVSDFARIVAAQHN